jgi:DNA sulfur modification protein DndE
MKLVSALILILVLSVLAFSQKTPVAIYLIGDSTVADKPLIDNPERGWGQILPTFLDENVIVRNHAVNGRSTKSFIDEGRWDAVLKELKSDDWVFIQFGHNDQKSEDPTRFAAANSDYRKNLTRFVTEARAKNAKVLLITPVMRRRFDEAGKFFDTHGEYPAAVKAVAQELNVPLFDLHQKSRVVIEQHGAEGSKKIFLHFGANHFEKIKDAKKDDTHFSEYGAALMASLVAGGLRELNLSAAKYLKRSDFNEKLAYELPKIYEPHFSRAIFNIKDFGAKPDALTSNTKAFNDAIAAANAAGGGTVFVPAGIWLTGPLLLKSNVRLHLEKGALIAFSKNRDEYPLVETSFEGVAAFRAQAPISVYRAENVAITGEGIIDGGGSAWKPVKRGKMTETAWRALVASGGKLSADGNTWYPSESALRGSLTGDVGKMSAGKTRADFEAVKDFLRPNMVQITESRNVLIEGVTFQDSPAWTLHFLLSEHITIRGVAVKNPWFGQNNDAVDLESSRNALLEDCVFDTGDDAITLKSGRDAEGRRRNVPTENVVARNMTIYRAHGGFVIGSEMSGGVRNVFISNSVFIGTDIGLRFKTQRGRGGLVENVYAAHLVMKDIPGDAISFDMYYGGKNQKTEKFAVSEATPRFENFFIHDIIIQGAKRGIFLRGLPEMNVKNIRLENLTVIADAGMYAEEAEGVSIKNLTLLAKDTNPLITILNGKQIAFDNLKYQAGAELLVSVSGDASRDVSLTNTDISKAKKGVLTAASTTVNSVRSAQ